MGECLLMGLAIMFGLPLVAIVGSAAGVMLMLLIERYCDEY